MNKGLRLAPAQSAKDKFHAVSAQLKNQEMAARITQMMIERLMENGRGMAEDVSRLFQLVNEQQYKLLAIQKHFNVDAVALTSIVNEIRLKDFTEASDKEDLAQNYTVVNTVEDDCTVVLTSVTPKETDDKGIFRSRIKLLDCGVPALIEAFKGQSVGHKATVQLNGVEHEVELLAVRKPAPVVEVPQEQQAPVLASVESVLA